jgi:hypothetical protein
MVVKGTDKGPAWTKAGGPAWGSIAKGGQLFSTVVEIATHSILALSGEPKGLLSDGRSFLQVLKASASPPASRTQSA